MASPSLTPSQAFSHAFARIAQLKGRSRRSEYWWVSGLHIVMFVLCPPQVGMVMGIVTTPLAVRRLHDTGRSGWLLVWNWLFAFVLILVALAFSLTVAADYVCVPVEEALNEGKDGVDTLLVVGWDALLKAGLPAVVARYKLFFAVYGVFLLAYWAYTTFIYGCMCKDSIPCANRYGASPKYTPGSPAAPAA